MMTTSPQDIISEIHAIENYAIPAAIRALRYLANHARPWGGNDFPNSECCYMIADELERILENYEVLKK